MLNHLTDLLLPSIAHFHIGGYWIALFAAFLETSIGLGLLLPGSTIILILGAFSARGYLDVGDLVWFAVLGAIIGDNLNYYLGKKYGHKWLKDGLWLIKPDHMAKAKNFMDTHGSKSVFLGRFIPSVKEIVPLIAGSVKMNRRKFMVWNVLGAIGWGFEWVLAGYIFGKSLNLAEWWLSRAGLLVALLLIFIGLLYFCKWLIIRKGKAIWSIAGSVWQAVGKAVQHNEHVRAWKQTHPRSISFLKARLDKTQFSGLTLTIFALAFIYVLALLGGIVEDFITSDPIVAADIRVANLFAAFRTHTFTRVFTWITLLGKSQVVIVFILISAALLWIWRKKYCIASLVLVVIGSETFTYLGKLAFHRPRPEVGVYLERSFSFPSGHATIAAAFYGFAGYLLIRSVQSWKRKVNIFFLTILVIIAIGLSRLYLGEHFVSDVWSGYLVGALWLIIAIALSEWLRNKERIGPSPSLPRGARPIALVLVGIAALFYIGFALIYHPPTVPAVVQKPVIVGKSTDIFTTPQMKFTETLIGEKQEPLNFIFLAGNQDRIVAALQQAGWVVTDKDNIPSFIQAVKALILNIPHPSAPISPSFWDAKIQNLSLAKVPGRNWLSNAHHLKLWRTHFVLHNGNTVYVAITDAHRGLKWGFIPKVNPDLDTAREMLYRDLNSVGALKDHTKIQLVQPLVGTNFFGDPFFTDGKAYIVVLGGRS